MKQANRHPLITGTIVLTLTGLISRVIGFFYRIYLSRLFGEEGMGIYQLIGPVLALSFSLTAAGYQTAISKFVAEKTAKEKASSFQPLLAGLSICIPLSLLCCIVIYTASEPIARCLLMEPRTASMLRVVSFSIPLSAVHSCINGYFYGIKKTAVPAITQLLEQCCRVGCVYGVAACAFSQGKTPAISVAVLGLVVGEFFSMLVSVFSIYRCYYKAHSLSGTQAPSISCHGTPADSRSGSYGSGSPDDSRSGSYGSGSPDDSRSGSYSSGSPDDSRSGSYDSGSSKHHTVRSAMHSFRKRSFSRRTSLRSVYGAILGMALPLTANRIVLNLLQSIEAVSIPARLRLYGYDTATALSVYGVLTGMAMPLIFFPNALTGSIAVLLLPVISEAYALGDMDKVKNAAFRTIKYCTLLGFLCMGGFLLFGRFAGEILFHSELAGHFILTLSFICPFLYLDTTLSSILQGLGMAGQIFLMNVVCLLLRLAFIFCAVPRFGITGYLWGLLASQMLQTILYLFCLFKSSLSHPDKRCSSAPFKSHIL